MKLQLEPVTRSSATSVVLPADLDPNSVAVGVERLRSWAAVRGETVVGEPFIRLHGDFVSFVHVPVTGQVRPHPETGITVEETRETPAVAIRGVRFEEIRAVVRALTAEFSTRPGTRVIGPADFIADDSRTFMTGSVVLPVDGPLTALPPVIAIPDATTPAGPDEAEELIDAPIRVVTVARQVGTEGDAIARLIARELGWDYYDYHIVMAAADEAGVNPETVERAIQRRPLTDRVLETLAGGALSYGEYTWVAPVPVRTSPLMTSEEFRRLVEEVIAQLAERGDAVIVGHGGQFALHARADTLRVLVTGTESRRTRRIMGNMGVPESEARSLVQSTDDERIGYFRTMHHRDWLDPNSYDLCLNTDRLSAARAAATVISLVRASRRPAEPEDEQP